MNDDNEYELLYMYRKGDLQALDLLMKMVLPFVIKTYASIAAHWPSFESDEARQAAWLGVINAVYYFREDRKMSFRNFILMCVERQMYSALPSNQAEGASSSMCGKEQSMACTVSWV